MPNLQFLVCALRRATACPSVRAWSWLRRSATPVARYVKTGALVTSIMTLPYHVVPEYEAVRA